MKRKVFWIFSGAIAFIIILLFGLYLYFAMNLAKAHRDNHFVEGEFVGVNNLNNDETFTLTVTLISKEDFLNSNGINTVHDTYKNLYFRLNFYSHVKGQDEKKNITCKNLIGGGAPIRYEDELGNRIRPNRTNNNLGNVKTYDYYIVIVDLTINEDIGVSELYKK